MNTAFYIAKRYIFSSSKATSVNIITAVSITGIAFSSAALFTILSIFSGLEALNIKLYSKTNPDLKITATKGKTLPKINFVLKTLNQNQGIEAFSKVIEEKVYITYNQKEDIAYLKSFDENYNQINRIDTTLIIGEFKKIFTEKRIVLSDVIARNLQMYFEDEIPAKLLMPKAGTDLINDENEDYNSEYVHFGGVFFLNDQYDRTILSNLSIAQDLLELKEDECYSIEIKTNRSKTPNQIKKELMKSLGEAYKIETRQEQNAIFLQVMNIENLMIYLIFTLIIAIASFNLAGAIAIIILDKKQQIKTLWSFGMPLKKIKEIFFTVGFSVTFISLVIGLLIGSILCLIQWLFGLVSAAPEIPFPVKFSLSNYLVVITTVCIIGAIISFFVSRRVSIQQ